MIYNLIKDMKYKYLSKKEVKQFLNKIKQQYKIKELNLDYVFLKNKDKILAISKDISKIDFTKLNINTIGIYFADVENKLRLTIEGSQIIGPLAKDNILEINEKQMKDYFNGKDLIINKEFKDFVILKYDDKFLGTGKYENGKIVNFFPKERRVKFK